MRITLDQIPRDGFELKVGLSDRWAREAANSAFDAAPDTLAMQLLIERIGQSVKVTGEASASFHRPCDRCQRSVQVAVDGDVELRYFPNEVEGATERRRSPDPEDEDAIELTPADLDMGWFDGQAIDVEQVVSEQYALMAPARVTCDSPGATAEPGPCVLPAEAVDSHPFSPFAGIRLPK
jgi:uncharacterized metal-binding protein YceD (DUF177 family)